jgi:hypothetical protein
MARVSSLLVGLALAMSSTPIGARSPESNTLTCDPAQLRETSYRLTTEAQALNLTRPRTQWWDAFDITLGPYRDALADINEASLAIAERALEIDSHNMLAHAQIARQLFVLGEDGDRARAEIARIFDAGGAIVWTATLYDVDAHDYFLMAFSATGIRVYRFGEAAGSFERHLGVPEFPGPEAIGLWRALGGCLGGLRAEADVSWAEVYEIKALRRLLQVQPPGSCLRRSRQDEDAGRVQSRAPRRHRHRGTSRDARHASRRTAVGPWNRYWSDGLPGSYPPYARGDRRSSRAHQAAKGESKRRLVATSSQGSVFTA